jgi:hypothetical protein
MTPIPRPDLHTAIEKLNGLDEFRVVCAFIRDERERFFGDLRQAETSSDVMKLAGSVATCDELLQVLGGSNSPL